MHVYAYNMSISKNNNFLPRGVLADTDLAFSFQAVWIIAPRELEVERSDIWPYDEMMLGCIPRTTRRRARCIIVL